MELRHLRYFVAVAEELSFRRAAQRLHLSQPTLTRQMQALEEELRVRLLERNRRRQVVLTAAGQSLLADAQQVLATVAAAGRRAQRAAGQERNQLNIATIAALSAAFLPGCLRAFRAEFPEVEVRLFELERAEQLAALREGRIHAGIFPCLGAALEPGLESQIVWTCPMLAVLPAGHPLAKRPKIGGHRLDIRALAGEVLVIPSPEGAPGYLERLNRICEAANFRPASLRPVDGADNVLGMVAAGYGVAILPEVLVGDASPMCVTRPLRAPVPPLELKLIWLQATATASLQNFVVVARRCAARR